MTEFKRWDAYVAEASKPPFKIPVSDDRTIEIGAPTGGQVMDLQRAEQRGDLEEMLRILCGDSADEVLELLRDAPAGVMMALLPDMTKHFGLDAPGELLASSR